MKGVSIYQGMSVYQNEYGTIFCKQTGLACEQGFLDKCQLKTTKLFDQSNTRNQQKIIKT